MNIQEKPIGHLASLLQSGPKPIIFLGAGASIKSGIPSTEEFIDIAAKWSFAKENGWPPEDLRIRRSDWLPWLEQKAWFDSSKPHSYNYPFVVDNLLQPREARKEFFLKILKPEIPPSLGYQKLAELIGYKAFDTILTTNFDSLVAEACGTTPKVHHITEIKNSSDLVKFSTSPVHAQLIHLHGDIENYTDKNLIEEVESLDQRFVEALTPIMRDHPIIIVGYRGAEKSIMEHLFIDSCSKTDNYKHGIYWCILENEEIDNLSEYVKTFATQIGHNFQLVKIAGFDELISNGLWQSYSYTQSNLNANTTSAIAGIPPIHDLLPVSGATMTDFDTVLLKTRIIQYCNALRITIPPNVSEVWLARAQLERDLIVDNEGVTVPTFAGYLLFAKEPDKHIKNISIEVEIEKNQAWLDYIFKNSNDTASEFDIVTQHEVKGNLWEQLDQVNEIVSQFNKPFRLKGEVSDTVYPYPPIALKELLVNALVHRDYTITENIKLKVSPNCIEILNPGGLTSDVKIALGDETIQEKIKKGKKGIKGYRNPVLADFFYSSGAMDKAGSGLADVYEMVEGVGGKVTFGPIENNTFFSAKIYPRTEAVDAITKTAAPKTHITSTFISNVLELSSISEKVWIGQTEHSSPGGIWEAYSTEWIPPFIIHNKSIITFADLSDNKNALYFCVDQGTVEAFSIDEFNSNQDMERVFVRLMNVNLYRHMDCLGLVVDKEKKRAYFPKLNDENNRTVSYQARVKSATRTVAKRIIKKATNEVLYWEHKSFYFSIEKFDTKWALIILPGYVFSVNGERWLVNHTKITKLATKRSAIDYNQHVVNDLTFWVWVLSEGAKSNFNFKAFKGVEKEIITNNTITASVHLTQAKQIDFNPLEEEIELYQEDDQEIIEEEIARMAEEEMIRKSDSDTHE